VYRNFSLEEVDSQHKARFQLITTVSVTSTVTITRIRKKWRTFTKVLRAISRITRLQQGSRIRIQNLCKNTRWIRLCGWNNKISCGNGSRLKTVKLAVEVETKNEISSSGDSNLQTDQNMVASKSAISLPEHRLPVSDENYKDCPQLNSWSQSSVDTLLNHLCLLRLDYVTNVKWKEHTRDNAFSKLNE
jgi:hypothetical protein